MTNKTLSEQLKFWRANRPDEWTMDEFIRVAEKLEQELATQAEAGFIRGYFYARQYGFQSEEELDAAADSYARSIIKQRDKNPHD